MHLPSWEGRIVCQERKKSAASGLKEQGIATYLNTIRAIAMAFVLSSERVFGKDIITNFV